METIKLTQVMPDPNQPRKYFGAETMAKLKDSIKKHGIMNPLILEKNGDKFTILDGERRYRAAVQLGLKEVPYILVKSKNPYERLIEQFHIQEQHEAWSISEKAMAVLEIAKQSGQTIEEIASLLSINNNQVAHYKAFALLTNKELFVSNSISIKNAQRIQGAKRLVRKIKTTVLEETWTLAEEHKLEKLLIGKIINGEITENTQFTKINDSFISEPKMIDVFMKGEIEVNEMFVKSKAKHSYHTRNLMHNVAYVIDHGIKFLAGNKTKLETGDIYKIKRALSTLGKILEVSE